LGVRYDQPEVTWTAIDEAIDAGFQHIVLALPAPYPADVAQWIVRSSSSGSRRRVPLVAALAVADPSAPLVFERSITDELVEMSLERVKPVVSDLRSPPLRTSSNRAPPMAVISCPRGVT
jgi:hypothetical protein